MCVQYQQHFVRSFGWYENASTIFIAMEFVEHGDLQQYVGRAMPEPEMQLIVSQVLEGLSHMHNLSYAHRDLKPAVCEAFSNDLAWLMRYVPSCRTSWYIVKVLNGMSRSQTLG